MLERKELALYVQLLLPNSVNRLSHTLSKNAVRMDKNASVFPTLRSLQWSKGVLLLLTDVTDRFSISLHFADSLRN